MDKMVHKSEKKVIVVTFQVSLIASAVAMSADGCQRWCVPKVTANSFKNTFLANTFVLPQVLPDRILKNIVAISGPRSTLATVC